MKLPERKGIVKPEWADELEQGLKLLWDGVSDSANKQSFICFTIADLSLKKEISSRIPGHTYFGRWYFGRWYLAKISMKCSDAEIQAARKAWMLDMIEEFRGPCKSSS